MYLSIDQSLRASGIVIGKNLSIIHKETHRTTGLSEDEALLSLFNKLNSLISEYDIKHLIYEAVQLQGNTQTLIILARVQGIVKLVAELNNLQSCTQISASTWKSFHEIRGRGRTEQKRNAKLKATELYGIEFTNDEADAALMLSAAGGFDFE